jgi:hypothetical protein
MATRSRRWCLAGLIILTVNALACNPLSVPYFLFYGTDPKLDPKFKLSSDDHHKGVKVVILASTTQLETRPELVRADTELSALFAQKLQEECKKNHENVTVATSSKVQRFKDDHPNWQSLSLEELGKRLEADYVVDLEIDQLSLYEAGSQNTLFLGKAAISVTVVDVRKADTGSVFEEHYTREFPHSGSVPVNESNPQKFRRDFLGRIAADLTAMFTAYPSSDQYRCE